MKELKLILKYEHVKRKEKKERKKDPVLGCH